MKVRQLEPCICSLVPYIGKNTALPAAPLEGRMERTCTCRIMCNISIKRFFWDHDLSGRYINLSYEFILHAVATFVPVPPKWSSNMAAGLCEVGQVKSQGAVGGMMFLETRLSCWTGAHPSWYLNGNHCGVSHLEGCINKLVGLSLWVICYSKQSIVPCDAASSHVYPSNAMPYSITRDPI